MSSAPGPWQFGLVRRPYPDSKSGSAERAPRARVEGSSAWVAARHIAAQLMVWCDRGCSVDLAPDDPEVDEAEVHRLSADLEAVSQDLKQRIFVFGSVF